MTGNYAKLLISGSASDDQCKEQWNKIVAENFDNSGTTFDFLNYIDNLEGYNHFLQEHNTVIAQLVILHFQIDHGIINELNEKGYQIDISGKKAYLKSLIEAVQRSRHLLSRIKMKANEIAANSPQTEENEITFDEVMASLIMNLGFTVSDDITLARYNQYRKIIRERQRLAEV